MATVLGPGWYVSHRGGGCLYWAGPHVITPETIDYGPGHWSDEEGEHFMPPPPGEILCPGNYFRGPKGHVGATENGAASVAGPVLIAVGAAALLWLGFKVFG